MLRLASLVAAAAVAATAVAQDRTADVDKIFSWVAPGGPGCAVAVSLHGKQVVSRAYGSADLERDVAIKPDTVFDAGSIVKQFVAASVLLLAEEGRLSLSDDVHKYIPQLPDYGQKITIDQLLTHTSGVRDWTALRPLAAKDADALTLILRQRGLNFAPGEEWAYSNSGYVLLKEIVARTSGTSFGEFAHKRLFEALGMTSTSYTEDLRQIVKNRALAYEKENGRWKMAMLLDNDRGGGGALLTTTADLLTWIDGLIGGRLGPYVTAKIQEPARLGNGRKIDYARGLFLDTYRGTPVVWHSGSAAGYKGLVSRFPEHDLSVAILCNSGDGTDRVTFASRIDDLFAPPKPGADAEPKEAPGANVPAAELNARTGLFFNERTGEPLRLDVQEGRLRIAGGPALAAVTSDRFRRVGTRLEFLSGQPFDLQFLSVDRFEMKAADGKTTRYRRAVAYAPTAEELQSLAGRYESDEIGTVFGISPGKEGLLIRLEHAPNRQLEFKPVDRDTFQRSMIVVRFRRDKEGKVIGLDYGNPLLRNVPFSRR